MTKTQERLLKGYVQKCASDYKSPSVINLTAPIQEEYEQHEEEDAQTLGVLLGNVILNSHFIGLQGHQEAAFFQFWQDVATEVKAA